MAIAQREPRGPECLAAIKADGEAIISAGTMAEALIVALRRGIKDEMEELIADLALDVIPVTRASSLRSRNAYARWGRGINRARLNYGDCFSYELAQQYDCPLLYIGEDFAKTDIASAL
jgi:ribonuclease VapC